MEIVKVKKAILNRIVKVLKKGGLVIMPTETVYIAAIDSTNLKAVEKLIKYKNRPFGKPFSVGIDSLKMAKKYAFLNKTALNLYKTFYPGPMTIVCAGKHKVAKGIESETGTLGFFITNHKLTIDVIKVLGRPITTTSANASYQSRPFNIPDLLKNLSGKQKKLIDLIVNFGQIPIREASTVIDTTLDDPAVLRQGGIKIKDKNEILSRSPENTQNLAKELWQKYEIYNGKRAIVFALEGPMGAGKTQFTKGLAKAMGIKEEVVSPTYDLILEYQPSNSKHSQPIAHNPQLCHIDAWRISSASEFAELDFTKLITDKSVIAIEWADRVAEIIRKYHEEAVIIWVKIVYGKAETERIISWGVV